MTALSPLDRLKVKHAVVVMKTPKAAVARTYGVCHSTVVRIVTGTTAPASTARAEAPSRAWALARVSAKRR